MESTHEVIRRQLELSIVGPLHDGMFVIYRSDNTRWTGLEFVAIGQKPKRYRSYAAAKKAADEIPIILHGHNGRMELTPEQARKVLAGGELVQTIEGVKVK